MNDNFMKTKPVLPLLLSLALPMMLSMLVNSLYNIIDSFFVAKISEDAMTALSLVFPVQNFINAVAIGFGIGINAVVAFFLGAGDNRRANQATTLGVILAIVHGILLTVGSILFIPYFLKMFSHSENVISLGIEYSNIVFAFSLIIMLNVGFEKIFQSVGKMKVTMFSMMAGSITNIILDPILIFGIGPFPRMEIKGAAIASVLAEASSILFFLIYTYITVDLKKYGLNRLRTFDPALLIRILSISCFTMLQYFLSMATWFVFFVAVERLGQRELAIANIVRSIYVVLLIPVNALATTTNSLVSNAIGAGGIRYVMPLINKIARFSFFIMLGLVALSALFPQFLLSIYTSENALVTESVPSVYVICCAMLIASVANVVFNGISGTGNTQAALLLETITIIIYGSYIIFIGMWLKAPIEICFTIEILYYTLLLITSYIYLKKAKWQNKKI